MRTWIRIVDRLSVGILEPFEFDEPGHALRAPLLLPTTACAHRPPIGWAGNHADVKSQDGCNVTKTGVDVPSARIPIPTPRLEKVRENGHPENDRR